MKRYVAASNSDEYRKVLRKVADDIVDLLYKEDISQVELWNYKLYEPIDRIGIVEVYINGDWKHDHWRADELVQENFKIIKSSSYATEDTGSDWGPEVHSYYVYLPDYAEGEQL